MRDGTGALKGRRQELTGYKRPFRCRPAYWVCVGLVVAAALSLVVVHFIFCVDCPIPLLVAKWSAGELIGFIGSVLGAIATIIAVTMTVDHAEKSQNKEYELQVLPCVAVEILERRNMGSALDDYGTSNYPVTERRPYEEVPHGKEYAVLSGDKASYSNQLSSSQQTNIETFDSAQDFGSGVTASVVNPVQYIPLVFKSIGNGPALDVSLALVRATSLEEVPNGGFVTVPVTQMPVGSQRYLGVYVENRFDPLLAGDYHVVVDYFDILGNGYRQGFSLRLINDDTAKSGYEFSYAVKRQILKHRTII